MTHDTYRVIFLDFDGVLNSVDYLKSRAAIRQVDIDDDINDVDPAAVARLQRIVDATDARIVISSTWRIIHEADELRDILKARGLTAKVIGTTPIHRNAGRLRGDEIQEWLDRASIFPRRPDGIVILDDSEDMGRLLPWLVRTTSEHGLKDYHVTKAIEMLGRPHPPVFVDAASSASRGASENEPRPSNGAESDK